MLLKGEIATSSRLPNGHILSAGKSCHGAIGLSKRKDGKKDSIVMTIFTSKNKSGTKYRVKSNVNQVFSKCIDKGKITICLKEPPHNIAVSQASPQDLKKFLHILKLSHKGEEDSETPLNVSSFTPKVMDLEKPKTDLKILSRKDYPISTSFPLTLTRLTVNGCGMTKLDSRILRLKSLKMLDLNRNQLKDLPESMDSLCCLEELILSRNSFQRLPISLFHPGIRQTIKILDLSYNEIDTVPSNICFFKSIVKLNLECNKIQLLPNAMGLLWKTLRMLNIAGNDVRKLPHSFCKFNLDSLDLSGNPSCYPLPDHSSGKNLTAVPTLYELSARAIKDQRLVYKDGMIPQIIYNYLEAGKQCLCGRACFESYAVYTTTFDLRRISHTITADVYENGCPVKSMHGYLCSINCHVKWLKNPKALWK